MTATHMVFGTLCALGCAVGAADGRTWFGAGHYNVDNASYVWSNALLWDRSAVAGEGGVATFGGVCFKGFRQDVEGLVLGGLDFAGCGASYFKGWGDYLVGHDITMTNAAFIASDDVRPQATEALDFEGRQPQKLSLTLRGTGGNTLAKRGAGTIDVARPVEDFTAFRAADGLLLAQTAVDGRVLTGKGVTLELAGGAVEPRVEGDLTLGGRLHVGPGAGELALPDGVNLTVPALTFAADGAAVVSNGAFAAADGRAGKLFFTEHPADAKGRVDPRLVMRDWTAYGAPFRFAKYDAQTGLQPIRTTDALVKPFAEAGADDIAYVTAEASAGTYAVEADRQVKALLVDNRANLSIAEGVTLTVGDGVHPAGVIFSEQETGEAYTAFSGEGTLAFGDAPGVIWKSTPTDAQGRGLDVETRITGTKGVTFASRATGAKNVYALFRLKDGIAGWTGPTYCYNARLWASGASGFLPAGGEVYIRGGRQPYSAQLLASGQTFDQHFHLSGYGAQGYRGDGGDDGLGALYAGEKSTSVFNGVTTLEDETLVNVWKADAQVVLNGVVEGTGLLALTGQGRVALNAANTFSGGLRIANHAGRAGGAPTVTAAGAAALGTGPVTVAAGGQLVFAPGLVQETVTNAITSTSARPVSFERSTLDLAGPFASAKTQVDAFTATNACSSIGVGACVDFGEVSWVNSAAKGELRATTAASTFKAGGAADFTLNVALRDGAGRLGFTKTGTNTVTLVGAKAYTGPTVVEGGTLRLEGDILASPSIAYWLDASRPETVDVDAAGRVTAWRSVVGGYTFAAGTYSGPKGAEVYPTPTYKRENEKKINGLDVVTFNNLGENDHEALAGTTDATQRSVFIAVRMNGCPFKFGGLFGRLNADNGLRVDGPSDTGGNWAHTVSSYKYNTDGILYKNGVQGKDYTAFTYGEVQVLTQFHAYDMEPRSYATFRPSLGVYSSYAGADGSYYRAVAADVCEVIAFDRVLTAAERQRVENYLAEKWRGAPCHDAPEAVPPTLAAGTDLTLRAGATLDLHGGDLTVASLAGEGAITNSGARAATLRVTGETAFSGTVGGAVTLAAGGAAQLKVAVQDGADVRLEGGTAQIAAYTETVPTDHLAYWLDAGRPETVRTNAAGEVTNWLSRAASSVAGFEYTSTTKLDSYASAAPRAWEPAGLNGKPAVHFADPTQIMKSTAKVRTRTFFLVAKLDGAQKNMGAPWGIWGQDVEYRFAWDTTDGAITSLSLITPAVPGDTLHINGADIPLVAMTTTHRLGSDVFLLSFRLGDAHRDLESNRHFNFHGLNRNFQDRGAKQRVGEVICYERALTDEEYAAVEGYLTRKWIASGTGPLPATPAVFADGAGLSLSGGGGTVAGDVRLNGPLVVDARNRTALAPLVVTGNLVIGDAATVLVRNYLNLAGAARHPALVVQGAVTGDFADVQGLAGAWRFVRAGNTWSVLHALGTWLIFR